jgi:hypothetical protein
MPMLLDLLTVFFIVAGCVLLWLNLRLRRPHIVLTKTDDLHQPVPAQQGLDTTEKHPLLDVLQQHVSEAEANPESAAEDNAYVNRVAAGIVKARNSNPS